MENISNMGIAVVMSNTENKNQMSWASTDKTLLDTGEKNIGKDSTYNEEGIEELEQKECKIRNSGQEPIDDDSVCADGKKHAKTSNEKEEREKELLDKREDGNNTEETDNNMDNTGGKIQETHKTVDKIEETDKTDDKIKEADKMDDKIEDTDKTDNKIEDTDKTDDKIEETHKITENSNAQIEKPDGETEIPGEEIKNCEDQVASCDEGIVSSDTEGSTDTEEVNSKKEKQDTIKQNTSGKTIKESEDRENKDAHITDSEETNKSRDKVSRTQEDASHNSYEESYDLYDVETPTDDSQNSERRAYHKEGEAIHRESGQRDQSIDRDSYPYDKHSMSCRHHEYVYDDYHKSNGNSHRTKRRSKYESQNSYHDFTTAAYYSHSEPHLSYSNTYYTSSTYRSNTDEQYSYVPATDVFLNDGTLSPKYLPLFTSAFFMFKKSAATWIANAVHIFGIRVDPRALYQVFLPQLNTELIVEGSTVCPNPNEPNPTNPRSFYVKLPGLKLVHIPIAYFREDLRSFCLQDNEVEAIKCCILGQTYVGTRLRSANRNSYDLHNHKIKLQNLRNVVYNESLETGTFK